MPEIRHRYTGVERIEIAKYSVRYKELFSLQHFYMLLHEWLVEKEWVEKASEKFPEIAYIERVNPVEGREIWIRWRPSKVFKPFWRWDLDIDMHVLGLKEVEMLFKGQKVKVDKGEIKVSVTASLIIEKAWPGLLGLFKYWILHYLLRKQLAKQKADLYTEAMELQNAIKSYLKVEAYLPEREEALFFAKRR